MPKTTKKKREERRIETKTPGRYWLEVFEPVQEAWITTLQAGLEIEAKHQYPEDAEAELLRALNEDGGTACLELIRRESPVRVRCEIPAKISVRHQELVREHDNDEGQWRQTAPTVDTRYSSEFVDERQPIELHRFYPDGMQLVGLDHLRPDKVLKERWERPLEEEDE